MESLSSLGYPPPARGPVLPGRPPLLPRLFRLRALRSTGLYTTAVLECFSVCSRIISDCEILSERLPGLFEIPCQSGLPKPRALFLLSQHLRACKRSVMKSSKDYSPCFHPQGIECGRGQTEYGRAGSFAATEDIRPLPDAKTGLNDEVSGLESRTRWRSESPAWTSRAPVSTQYMVLSRRPLSEKNLFFGNGPNRAGVEKPDSFLVVKIRKKPCKASSSGFAFLEHSPILTFFFRIDRRSIFHSALAMNLLMQLFIRRVHEPGQGKTGGFSRVATYSTVAPTAADFSTSPRWSR